MGSVIEGPDGSLIITAEGVEGTHALSAEEAHALKRFILEGETRTGRIAITMESDDSLTITYDGE